MKDYVNAPKVLIEEAERAAVKAAFAEITVDGEPEGIKDILKAFAAVRRTEKEYSAKWKSMTDAHEGKEPEPVSFINSHHIVASAILAKSDFGGGHVEDMHPYNATAYHFARMCFAVVALEALSAAALANECEFYSDHYADDALKLLSR